MHFLFFFSSETSKIARWPFRKLVLQYYNHLARGVYLLLINPERGPYRENIARGLPGTDRAKQGPYKKDCGQGRCCPKGWKALGLKNQQRKCDTQVKKPN